MLTLLPGPQARADLGRTRDLDPTEGEGHQGKWETHSEDREGGMEGKLCKYFNNICFSVLCFCRGVDRMSLRL